MVDPIPGTKHGFQISDGTEDKELQAFLKAYPEVIRCFIVSSEDYVRLFYGRSRVTVNSNVAHRQFYINHLS